MKKIKVMKTYQYRVGGCESGKTLFTPNKDFAYGRTNGTAKFFQLVYEAGGKVAPPRSLMDTKLLRLMNKFNRSAV